MQYKKICRAAALLVLVALLAATTVYYTNRQSSICMGVTVLDDNQTAQYINYAHTDLSDNIFFNKIPAAIDTQTDTIYISQKINADTKHYQLKGRLNCDDENIKLYFAADEMFDELENAVRNSHNFRLIADMGNGKYMQYNVVFTTLPVLNMSGEVVGKKFGKINPDETGERDVFGGTVSVWDNNYAKTNAYSTQSGIARWNIRGDASLSKPKKSYKISFKDEKGDNKDYDFLGLDPDDDWLLNAMFLDSLKVREKSIFDLWETLCEQTDYNYPMSQGKYVEVVNNGEYTGIYMLQRRIDGKYLDLDENLQLLKGEKFNGAHFFSAVSGNNTEKAIEFMQDYPYCKNVKYLNVENWIDNSLFIDAFLLWDNTFIFNTYFVIKDIDTNPQINVILWDTDYSFGLNMGKYEPESANVKRYNKNELTQIVWYCTDLKGKMCTRWAQLRADVLSTDNIKSVIQKNYDTLESSGAYLRDREKNGVLYGGKDTLESMFKFIDERMQYLDECYAEGIVLRTIDEQPIQ